MWLNLSATGHNLVWWHPCPTDATAELFLFANPHGTIINSDLELAALVLQESTLLKAVPKACIYAPRSGFDNIPTISWSTLKA